jgi:3-deoxy-manno-octulosonate cytidylyltransferase (CMP-KDO synthetase)
MDQKALIVIPARMASTRFPDKPMALIAGKTMIQRVWEIGMAAGDVVIATDDERLKNFAIRFGANVMMTSPHCLTGTDRVAEVAKSFPDVDIFFSLQGDAVLTPPWVVKNILKEMRENPEVQIATPAVRLGGKPLFDFVEEKKGGSSSGTVVVFNKKRDALYFSKALIPFDRSGHSVLYRHIGLYGYRREALLKLSELSEGMLEKAEKLEQLRALENGIPIRVVEVDYRGRTHGSVDRPQDVAIVERIIASEGELL